MRWEWQGLSAKPTKDPEGAPQTHIAAKRSAHDVANSSHAQTWTAGRQSACNAVDGL
jgi:hypothetical protein